jgi:hypothetical protein
MTKLTPCAINSRSMILSHHRIGYMFLRIIPECPDVNIEYRSIECNMLLIGNNT